MGGVLGGGGGSSSSSTSTSSTNVTVNTEVNPAFNIDTTALASSLDNLDAALAGIGTGTQQAFNDLGQAIKTTAAVQLKVAQDSQAQIGDISQKVIGAAVGLGAVFLLTRMGRK